MFTKDLTLDDILEQYVNSDIQYVSTMDINGNVMSFNLGIKKEHAEIRRILKNGYTDDNLLGWRTSTTCHWDEEHGEVDNNNIDNKEYHDDNQQNDAIQDNDSSDYDGIDDNEDVVDDKSDDMSVDETNPSESNPPKLIIKNNRHDSNHANNNRTPTDSNNQPSQPRNRKSNVRVVRRGDPVRTNDSDSESDLGLEDDGIMNSFSEMLKNASKTSVEIIASHPFIDRSNNVVSWKISFGVTGPVWYLKPEFLQHVLTCLYTRKNKKVPDFVDSLHDISIRKEEFGDESLYRRRKPTKKNMKGGTMARVAFHIKLPLVSQSLFPKYLDEALNMIFDVMKKRKRNNAGDLIMKWAKNENGQGLYGFLLNSKGGPNKSHDEAAKVMNEEIQHVFANGYTVSMHNPLDRLLVDFDIKEFLANEVGYNSWRDLPDREGTHVYKNFANKTLPDWSSIRKEPY